MRYYVEWMEKRVGYIEAADIKHAERTVLHRIKLSTPLATLLRIELVAPVVPLPTPPAPSGEAA